jgi:hypothetical protein
MALFNINEYNNDMKHGQSQYKKKISGIRCDQYDNKWGIDMNKCVNMPRLNASCEKRGSKERNKFKKKRWVKHSKPEGNTMYNHLNICNTLDIEYKRQWSNDYVFAYYCKDETGSNWRAFLDPSPCV